ncbi:MAG: DUF1080 domain-containing protein, partial [Candidatus Korobacteraceae bacterium]
MTWISRITHRGALIVSVLAVATLAVAKPGNFVPDATFQGSSLNGWHTLGQADWRAQNGEITAKAMPGSKGGWLILDRSYQDVQFYTEVRCTGGCNAGLLLRAEKTADGGMKGILVSIAEGERASYSVVLDAQGNETKREKLRATPPAQLLLAPPPAPEEAGRGGRGGGGGLVPMPGGIESPIKRSDGFRAGEWNSIEVALDMNIVRVFVNNGQGVAGGVADPEVGKFGPIGLYIGGTEEVRFRDIAWKDLQPRVAQPEEVSSNFRMQVVN